MTGLLHEQRLTELAVIDAAIEQLSRPGGFVNDAFFNDKRGEQVIHPGPRVTTTCAIGGVEQAIWRLTGTAILRDARNELARVVGEPSRPPTGDVEPVYLAVMSRLNRIAREMYHDPAAGDPVWTVEDVTFGYQYPEVTTSTEQLLADTLAVFHEAARQVCAEQAIHKVPVTA